MTLDSGELAIVRNLTKRERETLQWLAKGLSYRNIAIYMGVSVHSVRTWAQTLHEKLGTHNQVQTVRRGYELGVIEP